MNKSFDPPLPNATLRSRKTYLARNLVGVLGRMALTATILLALSALQIAPNMPHSSLMHRMNTRCGTPLLLAKKKGGKKKGGGGQKKSGMAWAQDFEIKPTDSAALRELAELLVSSYRTRTGKTLDRSLDRATDTPKALWAAPLCVRRIRRLRASLLRREARR